MNHRLQYFDMVFRYIFDNKIEGGYLEFGVEKGDSMLIAYQAAVSYCLLDMNFIGFDSFKGLPEGEGERFSRGQYSASMSQALSTLDSGNANLDRFLFIPGFFKDSLTSEVKKKIGKAAVVNVDCDLYVSTVPVLRFIEGLLDVGSILMFDDWYSFADEKNPEDFGELRAFSEWKYKDCFEKFYDMRENSSDLPGYAFRVKNENCFS